jgi:hypothetical protein
VGDLLQMALPVLMAGLQDRDDSVQAAAAEALVPLAPLLLQMQIEEVRGGVARMRCLLYTHGVGRMGLRTYMRQRGVLLAVLEPWRWLMFVRIAPLHVQAACLLLAVCIPVLSACKQYDSSTPTSAPSLISDRCAGCPLAAFSPVVPASNMTLQSSLCPRH